MRHRWIAALAIAACLAPTADGHAQLASRSHVLAPFYEILYRTRTSAGFTSFSVWMRNLQGSDPANPGTPFDLLGEYETLNFWGPWFPDFGLAEGTRGRVGVQGAPSLRNEREVQFFEDENHPDGGYFGFQLYPGNVNTGIYGCDLPPNAFDDPAVPDESESGFYQTCAKNGKPGWVTLEWRAAGSWTLHDLYVEAPFAGPGDVHVTPEPASMVLLGTGLAGLGASLRRRRRRNEADPSGQE